MAKEDTLSEELHMLLESVTDVHQLGFAVTDVPNDTSGARASGVSGVDDEDDDEMGVDENGALVSSKYSRRGDDSDSESRLTISDDDSDDDDDEDESDEEDDDYEDGEESYCRTGTETASSADRDRSGRGDDEDEHAEFLVRDDDAEAAALAALSGGGVAVGGLGHAAMGKSMKSKGLTSPKRRSRGPLSTVSVVGLQIDSQRTYQVARADVGDYVYTDRTLRWTHLPAQLRRQLYIRTPCDDKLIRSKQLMRFSVNRPALVLVLVDMRSAACPPTWLEEDGFRAVSDQAIARTVQHGALQEAFYGIYGQYYDRGEMVTLKGNWCKEVHSMYTVFVVPGPTPEQLTLTSSHAAMGSAEPSAHSNTVWKPVAAVKLAKHQESVTLQGKLLQEQQQQQQQQGVVVARRGHTDIKRLFEEVTYRQTYKRSAAGKCWTEGGNGLAMFYTDNDVVSVGVRMGKVWSDEFSINMNTNPHQGLYAHPFIHAITFSHPLIHTRPSHTPF